MAQYLAHHLLVGIRFTRQIANPPGFIAKQRGHFLPDCLLLCGEPGFVIRQVQPAVMAFNHPAFAHVFNQQQHQRIVFHRQRHASQALTTRTGFILMLFMVSGERVQDLTLPVCRNWRIEQAVAGLNKARLLGQLMQPFAAQLACPCKITQAHGPALKMHPQRGVIILSLRKRSQPLQVFRLTLAASRRVQRHHPRPGQLFPCGNVPQYQTVVIRQPERRIKNQFGKIVFQQGHAPGDMAGRVVNMQRLPLSQRDVCLQGDDDAFRRLGRGVGQQPVAAVKLLFFRIPGNVERDPLPGVGVLRRLILRM